MGRWRIAGLAILLFLTDGSPATSQDVPPERPSVQFLVEPYEEVVTPDSETRVVGLRLSFSCSQLEMRSLGMIEVHFRLSAAAAHVSQTVMPDREQVEPFNQTTCADAAARHVVRTSVHTQISRRRLAFEPIPLQAEAQLTYRPAGGDPETVGPHRAQFELRPDFVPLLKVEPGAQTQQILAGATAVFPIRLTSASNGDARVSLAAPAILPATVDLPADVELATPIRNQSLSAANVVLSVAPRRQGGEYPHPLPLEVRFRMVAIDERATSTEEQYASFLVEILRYDSQSSSSGGNPTFLWIGAFAVALLVLVLITLRRRRV